MLRPEFVLGSTVRRVLAGRFAALRLLAFAVLAALIPVSARAQATSAKVLYYGDFSTHKSSAVVQAGPGTRFGLEIVPEGGDKNAPVVLEVRVNPPGSSRAVEPVVFLVAGRMGRSVRLSYQFAHDWEVLPGAWSMEVLCGETRLTGAVFVVSKAQADSAGGNRPSALQMDKLPDFPPDNPAGKPSAKASDKAASPQAENSPERSVVKSPEAGRDRTPTPMSVDVAPAPTGSPVAPSVKGPPDRRVYVVMGGVFSEEGRALWMAALLKGMGASPCVRRMESEGRRLWGVVLGWRDTLDQARRLRDDMARVSKDLAVVSMSAGELADGLACK